MARISQLRITLAISAVTCVTKVPAPLTSLHGRTNNAPACRLACPPARVLQGVCPTCCAPELAGSDQSGALGSTPSCLRRSRQPAGPSASSCAPYSGWCVAVQLMLRDRRQHPTECLTQHMVALVVYRRHPLVHVHCLLCISDEDPSPLVYMCMCIFVPRAACIVTQSTRGTTVPACESD